LTKRITMALLCALVALSAGAVGATTLALWDFHDKNFTVDQGTGTMSLVGTSSSWEEDPYKADPLDPSTPAVSLEINGWPAYNDPSGTDGIVFSVPTTGRSNIKVRWDMRNSLKNNESGPNSIRFEYSTDGTTFIQGPTWTNHGDQWYFNRVVDLSGITAVNNNPNFKFRLMAVHEPHRGQYMPCEGAVYGNRKWRLDMITVYDDTTIPDPTIALWDFNDQRDLIADYAIRPTSAQLIGGVVIDNDGYQDDFAHDLEPWDESSSSDPSLKGKAYDTKGYPAQGVGSGTAGMEYRVSTEGCSGIKISFDTKQKTDSSRYVALYWTADINANPVIWNLGGTFSHQITDGVSQAWWFNNNTVDLSGQSSVNDNPNFAFKIVTIFAPGQNYYEPCDPMRTYNQDANMNKMRFDMVRVTAANASVSYTTSTIVEAKRDDEREPVSLRNVAVTYTHPDYFWVETSDRNCGLKVYAPQHNVSTDWKVDIDGITRLGRDYEKYIYASSVVPASWSTEWIKPVFINNRGIGGSAWFFDDLTNAGQPQVPGSVGLSNVGLLVKVTGRVTAVLMEDDDPSMVEYLYIDDGSNLYDGTRMIYDEVGGFWRKFDNDDDPDLAVPVRGLRIVTTKNFHNFDYLNKYVEVTGISSIDKINSIEDVWCKAIRRCRVKVLQ